MRFSELVPMLQTEDMAGTIRWYREVLGFTLIGSDGDNWCRLPRDEAAIMFMHNDHLGVPQATATQYIQVDDVMLLWSSIEAKCAAEWGPEIMPYGMHEFAIRDPNGYLLSFGQPVG